MTCRKCRYLDVPPDRSGRVIPRAHKTYNCKAPLPELPPLPASVNVANGYGGLQWPPSKFRMEPDDGAGCPLFEVGR